jgi:hypothetical protein
MLHLDSFQTHMVQVRTALLRTIQLDKLHLFQARRHIVHVPERGDVENRRRRVRETARGAGDEGERERAQNRASRRHHARGRPRIARFAIHSTHRFFFSFF